MNDQNRIKRAAALLDKALKLADQTGYSRGAFTQMIRAVNAVCGELTEPTDAEVLKLWPPAADLECHAIQFPYQKRITNEVKRQRGDAATIRSTYKHENDDYMHTVLVESGNEWIVWDYNDRNQGLFNGFYNSRESRAREEYNCRLEQW